MKDKEKQIQEIAQIICGRSKDDICIIDNTSCDSSCYWAREAEAIYNVGYRKYPEDSVVLSREEYEDYKKHIDNCIEEYYRGQHEAEVYYKNIQVPRERKETAEKILQPLYNACKEDTYGQVVVDFAILENLAKQFGVEIK